MLLQNFTFENFNLLSQLQDSGSPVLQLPYDIGVMEQVVEGSECVLPPWGCFRNDACSLSSVWEKS